MTKPTEIDKADIWRQAHDRLMEENLALKQKLITVKAALNVATQALDAERERHATENDAHYGYVQLAEKHLKECEQQLDAEREKAQQRANEGTKWYLEAKAERHKREACEVLIRDLQKELAATSL